MALSDYLAGIDDLRRRGKPTAAAAYDALATIVARGQLLADAYAAYQSRTARVIAVPFAEVLGTLQRIADFIGSYFADLDFDAGLFLELRDAGAALAQLEPLRLAFASQATATGGIPNVFEPTPAPPIPYRLRQGDTLERLALTYLGDEARAIEIADLNDLGYPFLDTIRDLTHPQFTADEFTAEYELGGEPDRTGVPDDVAVTGQTILLPADATVDDGTRGGFTNRDVELFGRDLAIAAGVLQVAPTGELVTVEGDQNMVQALRQRISTVRGELLLHPEYGIERLLVVGIEGTPANTRFSGLGVARTVVQDPRVTRVGDLAIAFEDTVNTAAMRVGLIGGRAVPMNLVLPEHAAA